MTTSERESPSFHTLSSDFQSACVPKAVAAQAARHPDALAVASGAQYLTYHELDCQANRLARFLRSRGAAADVPIGLCMPRSLEMVVSALAILKAGAAYLPMDPAYPTERLSFMLLDAQAPLLIADPTNAGRFPREKCEIVDPSSPQAASGPDHLPRVDILPGDLAYIIYTSGSTGRPKGVEVPHSALSNLAAWHREAFAVVPEDRASHVAGLGFDAAVWELWPYLAAGASVHLADEISRSSPELLRDWMISRRITIGFVPTPVAERMLSLEWPAGAALKTMLTGGDALHHYPPTGLPFELVNNYGPTECAVVATSGRIDSADHRGPMPHIGRAIANAAVYLLDERLHPVADGEPGEIYIGGAGVARGYRGRGDLTRERFIPNPFHGGRMYRTGDLGRRLPGGDIAFAGRADDQIKIRGYRIEPMEIVDALNQNPEIEDSIVVALDGERGEKRLAAYVRLAAGSGATHMALRDFLRQRLPEYMLPAVFVRVDSFPMTPNGKVDRAALPAPAPNNVVSDRGPGADPDAPATDTERRIADIVAGLLGLSDVGRDDNFFLLGGHSLLAAQLIARLRDAFGIEIPLRTLFASATVALLAGHIDGGAPQAPPFSEGHSCAGTEA